MTKRTLTIRLKQDWQSSLRAAARKATSKSYQGEELNYETAAVFFSKLTQRRWELISALQGQGTISIRELARRSERDVKRVHEDVATLIELGIFEREASGIACPFDLIHVDFEIARAA